MSGECKTSDSLISHPKNAIETVQFDYHAHVAGVVTNALGECQRTHCLLAKECLDIIFLDCYAHQVSCLFLSTLLHTKYLITKINLVVSNYFKSRVEALAFVDKAADLIT